MTSPEVVRRMKFVGAGSRRSPTVKPDDEWLDLSTEFKLRSGARRESIQLQNRSGKVTVGSRGPFIWALGPRLRIQLRDDGVDICAA